MDKLILKEDIVCLTYNSGVQLYGNLLVINSFQHQSIYFYRITVILIDRIDYEIALWETHTRRNFGMAR
jgi:hypothetical protein